MNALILRMLKKGGRSATIVPDGVLFGSTKAHVALRELLVKHHQLEAVISLPSGVFKAKHFMVPVKDIEEKGYDLSINRYKETVHEEVTFEPPKKIIAKLKKLEAEIAKDLDELEAML